MNNSQNDQTSILAEQFIDNNQPSEAKKASSNNYTNAIPSLENLSLLQQVNILTQQLHNSKELLNKYRLEQQHQEKLLQNKNTEIQNLYFKIKHMNNNIKCQQEHIKIEQNNYKNAKNKITYLLSKLQQTEQALQRKEQIIHNLKTEHETTMGRTQILIEEFYKDKFFAEPIPQEPEFDQTTIIEHSYS